MSGAFLFFAPNKTASAAYLELEPNDGLSIVGPYDVAIIGVGDWSCGSACKDSPGYREFITVGQKYRIRQTGTISKIKIYTYSNTDLTGIYLKIWRKNGSNYDLIGTSNNFANDLNMGIENITLSSPISGVQEGDYYGYRIEANSNIYHFNALSTSGVTKTTFLSNWTTMLNACQNNDIIPVVILIMPWTGGNTAQMNTRDDWNASLVALAETYEDAIIVDTSLAVGQYAADGLEGNLWDIKTAYNTDGVHFNSAGHGAIAAVLAEALEEYTDHLTITGNTSQTAGDTQTLTLWAINNFGDAHTAYTGDKTITFSGANFIGTNLPTFTDKNGGEIEFGSSGTITFTNGIATTDVKLYRTETAEIDAPIQPMVARLMI